MSLLIAFLFGMADNCINTSRTVLCALSSPDQNTQIFSIAKFFEVISSAKCPLSKSKWQVRYILRLCPKINDSTIAIFSSISLLSNLKRLILKLQVKMACILMVIAQWMSLYSHFVLVALTCTIVGSYFCATWFTRIFFKRIEYRESFAVVFFGKVIYSSQ